MPTKERKLTQVELERTLFQVEGYYSIPNLAEDREKNFEAAKAELISHLEKTIADVKLLEFASFAKMKRWK